MGLIARLAAAAPPRAFPVLGWDGEGLWDALRGTTRVASVRAPHDADLLVMAGEIPDAWYADLLDLYETLALPRLALWLGSRAAADGHAISLPGALHLGVDELDAHWPALLAALHDLDRPNNHPVLPDRPPAPWRGVGPHGQGGEGMMGGQPYGRPMAMTAEDPDQLALGDVPTALGPFFPGLPSGLQVDLRLQGDRIRTVEHVRNRFPVREVALDRLVGIDEQLAPAVRASLGEPVPLEALERARIRAHLDWAARLLDLVGLDAVALRFAAAAAAPGLDQRHIERLFTHAERWGLRRLIRGVGRISREQAEHLHLVGPLARASGIRRDARLDDPAYRAAEFDCIVGTDGDTWARWRLRRRECVQSFELIAAAGEATTTAAEAPNGELRRRGEGRLAGASAANLAAVKAGLPGLEWFEGVLFLASLGLDMREAALR